MALPQKRKRMAYDASFKLIVIEYAEENNNIKAGQHFDVNEKQVRDWRNKKTELMAMPKTKRANRTGTAQFPDMEVALTKWIMEQRQQAVRVSRLAIRVNALRMAKTGPASKFTASHGWCTRFMKRNNLSLLRQKTKICQQLPAELDNKLLVFQKFIIQKRKEYSFPLAMIGNMDETPMCFDMSPNTTVNAEGAKTVLVKTTGHEKTNFTVVLACFADGTKLDPMVIFKRETMPKEKFPSGVVVHVHPKGCMDEQGVELWLNRLWCRRNGGLLKKPALLVWDQFRAHLTNKVKEVLRRDHNTIQAVIPGGLSSLLQPLAVSLNKPFKTKVRQLWQERMAGDKAKLTAKGNLCPLPTVVSWVKEAWASIPPAMIKKSFLKTSISNALDGTEDDELWMDDDADSDNASHYSESEWNDLFGATDDEEEFESFS
ncbi:Pogo transposable element with KRAB domain [Nymphon striatum]|nr:Pogo transposable element with KRAB domain [Nymphon striatum]